MEAYAESLKIPQQMRDNEQWELVDGDEMMNAAQFADEMAWEASCAAGQCTALPETNLMTVKVGYDDTFNADLGSASAAAAYLDSMFTHVQTFFCHSTLGSKIKIEVTIRIKNIICSLRMSSHYLKQKLERWWLHSPCWKHLEG